jgi:hypothetical protein
VAVSFARIPQRIRSAYLSDFVMHGFDTKLAFDLIDESQTPDGDCFRLLSELFFLELLNV